MSRAGYLLWADVNMDADINIDKALLVVGGVA
jgi:hypothetical protein